MGSECIIGTRTELVAVTGGTGFVGRRLIQQLVKQGFRVRVLTRNQEHAEVLPDGIQLFVADLTDPEVALEAFLDGVQVLYHCAGELRDESKMYSLNVEATRRLAEMARGRVQHWVQLSSIGVYGQTVEDTVDESSPQAPSGVYENTKAESDKIVMEQSAAGGYTLSILRPANVFGSGMPGRSLGQLIDAVRRGFFFFTGKPGATVNFVHVDNVVEALLLCGKSRVARSRVFNLSDSHSMEEFAAITANIVGRRSPRVRLPESLVRLASNAFGILPGFPLTPNRIDTLVSRVRYSNARIEEELEYIPIISLETGLKKYALDSANELVESDHQFISQQEFNGWTGNSWEWSSLLYTTKMLWVLYFGFTAFVAILFQKLLLPLLPSLHAGQGLLATHDPQLHHAVAVALSEQIRELGWSSWTLWPHHASGLNSSLLAILYALFEPNPLLLVPVHAALHATAGVLLFLIGRSVWPGSVGLYGGLIAATLFVVFPSSLNWYAQPLKDGYAIVGLLLVLYSWVRWTVVSLEWRNVFVFVLSNLVGAVLLASVRPYGLQILLVVSSAAYLAVIPSMLTQKPRAVSRVVAGLAGILPILLLVLMVNGVSPLDQRSDGYAKTLGQGQGQCSYSDTWSWQPSSWMPTYLDRYAERISTIRAGITCAGYDAYSTIDKDIMPSNVTEMVSYLPRGLQIALWAPFPDTWFHDFSLTHMVGWAETIAWYLLMPGIVVALYYRRNSGVIFALFFALGFMLVYGYVTANVGTLHRVRYPFLFVLILLGLLGWVRLLGDLKKSNKNSGENANKKYYNMLVDDQINFFDLPKDLSRKGVANAGMLVLLFTAGSFLALFLREILMARWFGIGRELDAFFLAMVLPMFVANVINVPFGTVVVPLYQEVKTRLGLQKAQSLVSHLSFLSFALLGGASLIILLSGPEILRVVGWGFDEEQLAHAYHVLPFGASILLWSGSVVLCNSVLNAHNRFVVPVAAQIIVPIIAILTLYIFGDSWGILAVAVGMAVGQVVNLIIVIYLMRKNGVLMVPKWPSVTGEWRAGLPMFFTLVLAALFFNAVTVVDNAMASTLGPGSVGAYSLGSKVTLFITGVIGAGIIAVMLPHFSSYFVTDRVDEGRHELRFYLLLGAVIPVPLGLVFFLLADDMIHLVFYGSALDMTAVATVAKIAAFGVIQLPFFTCYLVLMKFANASKRNGVVLTISVFGLVLNVVLNIILMRHMGITGLALSTSLSMFAATILFMVLIHRLGHIGIFDILRIVLLWLLYLVAVLCLQIESFAGAVIACIALLLLVIGQKHHITASSLSTLIAINNKEYLQKKAQRGQR